MRATFFVTYGLSVLAVQNMEATGVFHKDNIEFTALEGSLNMMSKVLNDVLDLYAHLSSSACARADAQPVVPHSNRMDSGRFESVSRPYAFHKVIKSMLVPLHLAADARGLHLHIDLDPMIDTVARRALYKAAGETDEAIAKKMLASEDEESGMVVGDEHRLRQIVTNLTR